MNLIYRFIEWLFRYFDISIDDPKYDPVFDRIFGAGDEHEPGSPGFEEDPDRHDDFVRRTDEK